MVDPDAPDAGALIHRALIYGAEDEMVAGVAAFAREGLEAGEATVVLAAPDRLGSVRRRLGTDAPVGWIPNPLAGVRLGPGFDDVRRFLTRHAGEGRLRFAADWDLSGRPPSERRAFMRWEAAATALLARREVTVLCCHDGADVALAADVRATHPEVWSGDAWRPDETYRPAHLHLRDCAAPPPPRGAPIPLEDPWSLTSVRQAVIASGTDAGIDEDLLADFVIAVNEVAVNALWHARSPREARVGVVHGALVCEVSDSGPGLDPLPAHAPPASGTGGQRGLWIAHQLSDVVQVIPAGDGTRVRLELTIEAGRSGNP